jgi:hypothetical protein
VKQRKPRKQNKQKNPYRDFVDLYLARGAVGVSVALTAIAPSPAATNLNTSLTEQKVMKFADQLSNIRSAVSSIVSEPLILSQVSPPRPPVPPPFKNFFGKAPFQDSFRNVPNPNPPKAAGAQTATPDAPSSTSAIASSTTAPHSKKAFKKTGSKKGSKKILKKGSKKPSVTGPPPK